MRYPVLLLFLFIIVVWNQVVFGEDWQWKAQTSGTGITMRLTNELGQNYEIGIGSGGTIKEIVYTPESRQLLAEKSLKEILSRNIQWKYYTSYINTEKPEINNKKFCIAQSGNGQGQNAPIIDVSMNKDSVEIYSVPQNQWNQENDFYMQAKISTYTKYEMTAPGVLKVKKTLLVPEITINGQLAVGNDIYIEENLPFYKDSTNFDGYALGLNQDGTPAWWYGSGKSIPYYPGYPAQATAGYATVFKKTNTYSKPVISVVFGKKDIEFVGSRGNGLQQLNSMEWNTGISVIPGIMLYSVRPGSVIQYEYYIVIRNKMDELLKNTLDNLNRDIEPITVYSANEVLKGDIAEIVSKLKLNKSKEGERTTDFLKYIKEDIPAVTTDGGLMQISNENTTKSNINYKKPITQPKSKAGKNSGKK